MKKSILFISLLFVSLLSSAQIIFQKSYGEFDVDYGQSMVQTNDGGYCIVGGTGKDLADSSDILVIRTDIDGNQIWSARLAGTKDDFITSITTTDDGGFLLVGNTYSSPLDTSYSDIIAMKIDDGGFVYWSKTFGGADYDEAQSVIRSGDGGYIIFGNTLSYGTVTKSALAIKIDDAGNQVWSNVSDTYSSNYFYAGDRTLDGNYIAVGGTFDGSGGNGFENYITKIDTLGNIIWSKSNGTVGAEFLYDVKATMDGGYLMCGVSSTNTSGDADMSVIKVDSLGDVIWTYNYGTAEYDKASSILERSNTEIVVCGYTNIGTVSNVINQMVLLKLDAAGNLIWTKSYGDVSLTSEAYKVLEAADGYALCGYSIAFDPLGDSYLVKTDFNGNSGCYEQALVYSRTPTNLAANNGYSEINGFIDEFPTSFNPVAFTNQFSLVCYAVNVGDGPLNKQFELYPNPAKSFIKVQLNNGTAEGKITIHDLTGRVLQSREFSNESELLLNTENLLSGMYLITLESDNGLATKTFIKE